MIFEKLRFMFHFIKRHKLLSFFLLAIMILAIVTALRWKKWFHNPDERPYSVSDKPQWVLLTPGNGGETTRNISWMCGDIVYDAFAEVVDTGDGDTLKIKAEGEVFESRADNAAYYVARLNSLKPGLNIIRVNGKTKKVFY